MMAQPHPERTTDTLSIRVVEAIAAATDTDPFDLTPPLYDTINPEALDRLMRPDADCRVTFEYDGHAVEVRNDGTVSVDGTVYDER